MSVTAFFSSILFYSSIYGIAPTTAMSVAAIESNFNPKAIGAIGEVGLFQIRPEYSSYSAKELLNPHINIKEGIKKLSEAKRKCSHQLDRTWVICYNLGVAGAKKIKHPRQFEYYKKFTKKLKELRG